MLLGARKIFPNARRETEFIEAGIAVLVVLAMLGLAVGMAAMDTARLLTNALGLSSG